MKKRSDVIIQGRSIGQMIGSGKAKVLSNISQMDKIEKGDVLVADMTDPDLGTNHEKGFCYCNQ